MHRTSSVTFELMEPHWLISILYQCTSSFFRQVEKVSKAAVDAETKALIEAFDKRATTDAVYLRR